MISQNLVVCSKSEVRTSQNFAVPSDEIVMMVLLSAVKTAPFKYDVCPLFMMMSMSTMVENVFQKKKYLNSFSVFPLFNP